MQTKERSEQTDSIPKFMETEVCKKIPIKVERKSKNTTCNFKKQGQEISHIIK
jgi:hypothetical protein